MTSLSQHLTVNMSDMSSQGTFLLIHCDNVCFFSPLRESHGEWLLSRMIISVTSLLTFLSTPWVLLWESDAYIAPRSFLITEAQGLTLERGEPAHDIMQLHGQLSGWVRWMWADWKSLCSLCQGTKSSSSEGASNSVNVKVWVTALTGSYNVQ